MTDEKPANKPDKSMAVTAIEDRGETISKPTGIFVSCFRKISFGLTTQNPKRASELYQGSSAIEM